MSRDGMANGTVVSWEKITRRRKMGRSHCSRTLFGRQRGSAEAAASAEPWRRAKNARPYFTYTALSGRL